MNDTLCTYPCTTTNKTLKSYCHGDANKAHRCPRLPRTQRLAEGVGLSLTQMACGRYHSLCTDSQKVWAFGQNSQGQCTGDVRDGVKLWTPTQVRIASGDGDGDRVVHRLCGTCFSSLVMTRGVDGDSHPKLQALRKLQSMDFPASISFAQLDALCAQIERQENDITYLSALLTTVFGSPSCLNQSFMTHTNAFRGRSGTGVDFEAMHKAYRRVLGLSSLLTNRLTKVEPLSESDCLCN